MGGITNANVILQKRIIWDSQLILDAYSHKNANDHYRTVSESSLLVTIQMPMVFGSDITIASQCWSLAPIQMPRAKVDASGKISEE